MNFKKLQAMQLELDNSILSAKPQMTAEERFNKTLVALSVEVAEAANCAEHFKFWKDNKGKVDGKRFEKTGILIEGKPVYWDNLNKQEAKYKQAHKLTLVEEASDCLHFILSLANQLKIEIDTYAIVGQYQEKVYLLINTMIGAMCFENEKQEPFINVVRYFLGYIHSLGIAEQELEQAYYEKNEENYRSLREGY